MTIVNMERESIECPDCATEGIVYNHCESCDGTGHDVCWRCEDTGGWTCEDCDGMGCQYCYDGWLDCAYCGGIGHSDCDDCSATGEMEYECERCEGTGYI